MTGEEIIKEAERRGAIIEPHALDLDQSLALVLDVLMEDLKHVRAKNVVEFTSAEKIRPVPPMHDARCASSCALYESSQRATAALKKPLDLGEEPKQPKRYLLPAQCTDPDCEWTGPVPVGAMMRCPDCAAPLEWQPALGGLKADAFIVDDPQAPSVRVEVTRDDLENMIKADLDRAGIPDPGHSPIQYPPRPEPCKSCRVVGGHDPRCILSLDLALSHMEIEKLGEWLENGANEVFRARVLAAAIAHRALIMEHAKCKPATSRPRAFASKSRAEWWAAANLGQPLREILKAKLSPLLTEILKARLPLSLTEDDDLAFHNELEAAFWTFDTLRSRGNGAGPMAERDAFKAVMRDHLESPAEVHAGILEENADLTKRCQELDADRCKVIDERNKLAGERNKLAGLVANAKRSLREALVGWRDAAGAPLDPVDPTFIRIAELARFVDDPQSPELAIVDKMVKAEKQLENMLDHAKEPHIVWAMEQHSVGIDVAAEYRRMQQLVADAKRTNDDLGIRAMESESEVRQAGIVLGELLDRTMGSHSSSLFKNAAEVVKLADERAARSKGFEAMATRLRVESANWSSGATHKTLAIVGDLLGVREGETVKDMAILIREAGERAGFLNKSIIEGIDMLSEEESRQASKVGQLENDLIEACDAWKRSVAMLLGSGVTSKAASESDNTRIDQIDPRKRAGSHGARNATRANEHLGIDLNRRAHVLAVIAELHTLMHINTGDSNIEDGIERVRDAAIEWMKPRRAPPAAEPARVDEPGAPKGKRTHPADVNEALGIAHLKCKGLIADAEKRGDTEGVTAWQYALSSIEETERAMARARSKQDWSLPKPM